MEVLFIEEWQFRADLHGLLCSCNKTNQMAVGPHRCGSAAHPFHRDLGENAFSAAME